MEKLNKCYIDFCNAQDEFQSEFVKYIATHEMIRGNTDINNKTFYTIEWRYDIDRNISFLCKITDKSIDMDLLSLGRISIYNDNKYYPAIRLRLEAANKEYELKQQMEK